jgi:hypothetical protein
VLGLADHDGLNSTYSVEKLYLLARPKNLRPLQAAETTTHPGTLPQGAHVCPSSCIGPGACRERIESRECRRQKNHVAADSVFFNRIGRTETTGWRWQQPALSVLCLSRKLPS